MTARRAVQPPAPVAEQVAAVYREQSALHRELRAQQAAEESVVQEEAAEQLRRQRALEAAEAEVEAAHRKQRSEREFLQHFADLRESSYRERVADIAKQLRRMADEVERDGNRITQHDGKVDYLYAAERVVNIVADNGALQISSIIPRAYEAQQALHDAQQALDTHKEQQS